MLDDGFANWWLGARKRVLRWRWQAFDSLILLVDWLLWIERNDRTFSSRSCTAAALAIHVAEQLELWCRAGLIVRSHLVAE
jgi:hypothetical protein